MVTLNLTEMNNLLARYEELDKLKSSAEKQKYINDNWLKSDGTLKPKTAWTKFLHTCCFTRANFKRENSISLKKLEQKVATSLPENGTKDDLIKIGKCLLVLETFKEHKYGRGGQLFVKHSIAETIAFRFPMHILVHTQIKQATAEGKEEAIPPLQKQISNMTETLHKDLEKVTRDHTTFMARLGHQAKPPRLALYHKFMAFKTA